MSLAKDELFAYEPLTISNEAIEDEFVDISLANEALFAYDPLTVSKDAIEAELTDISLANEALLAYDPLTNSKEAIEEEFVTIELDIDDKLKSLPFTLRLPVMSASYIIMFTIYLFFNISISAFSSCIDLTNKGTILE